jgi:dienelactone hydrolase
MTAAEARSFEENTVKNRISINGRNGAFGAHVARPEALPAPAVVVLHEVFGVNADIRKRCDELAEQGFIAVAPDLMTFLTAVRYGVDAAVVYHGGDTEKYLGELNGFVSQLLMHLAEEDEFISKPAQAEIKAALASKPNATIYSYPGQHHAFAQFDADIREVR